MGKANKSHSRERSEEMEQHIQRSTNAMRTKLQPTVMSPLTSGERVDFGLGAPPPRDHGRNNQVWERLESNNSAGIEEYNKQYVKFEDDVEDPRRHCLQPVGSNFTFLNALEQSTLVGHLLDLINLSRTLESLKMELAMCDDFNLMDAFSIFDEDGKGYCDPDAYMSKLKFIGAVVPEKQYIDVFYIRYNKNNDGRLKYSEFMNAVCPMSESYTDMLINRKPKGKYSKPNHPISLWEGDTYGKFMSVLEHLLKIESAVQDTVSKLLQRKEFTAEKAFHTMALSQARDPSTRSIDHITIRDLQLLLQHHGHSNDLEDLDIRLLIDRFDKDNDGKISKGEFHERF